MPNLDLFAGEQPPPPLRPATDLAEAERLLLDLADYIYVNTSLKPMSKTLFVLSRCLLAAPTRNGDRVDELVRSYVESTESLGATPLHDDFDFATTLRECRDHLSHILSVLDRVRVLCADSDCLGLAFNTLLRGKWEGGEGLGTHLTPEEVVGPMTEMVFSSIARPLHELARTTTPEALLGDPCGGTGRFALALARQLRTMGFEPYQVGSMVRLYDQSSLSIDLARLNFAFDGIPSDFLRVNDSLTAPEVSGELQRYIAIATNPPFGTGKYRWSPDLERAMDRRLLRFLGLKQPGDTCDPSEIFVLRCLDLLATGGVLAIILPDGVLHARKFRQMLDHYEVVADGCALELLAIVSLPAVTFSLGGTVAKTSFLVLRKTEARQHAAAYIAHAKHIGFRKRGNRRVADPQGNDLLDVAQDYELRRANGGTWIKEWRSADRLAPSALQRMSGARKTAAGKPLSQMARLHKERGTTQATAAEPWYHVSILNVDGTGAIDVMKASANRPATPPQACRSGDVLLSCINPRIWRVCVVPNLEGNWTCSTEFAVLRPRDGVSPWELALRLHHATVIGTVTALASGTSSSRQRVDKSCLLHDVVVPDVDIDSSALASYVECREAFYNCVMDEHRAFQRLHEGIPRFQLSTDYVERRHSPSTRTVGSK
ncbi:MAG: N-6 DNA methylase [Acidobacteria bacterium]|nr:N-6 DNA methylase [Acidobacteriota bacterium]